MQEYPSDDDIVATCLWLIDSALETRAERINDERQQDTSDWVIAELSTQLGKYYLSQNTLAIILRE